VHLLMMAIQVGLVAVACMDHVERRTSNEILSRNRIPNQRHGKASSPTGTRKGSKGILDGVCLEYENGNIVRLSR
jgi:hypothetical protein